MRRGALLASTVASVVGATSACRSGRSDESAARLDAPPGGDDRRIGSQTRTRPDVATANVRGGPDDITPDNVALLEHTTAVAYQRSFPDGAIDAWHERVPQAEVVRIPSSIDGEMQSAIWYDSGSAQHRPLLVALHSWSADYEQNLDIPFAEFAVENDWVFMHPDFRGPNLRPQATASELAVQDVIDAVSFARHQTAVDPSRIYLVGYSGGAMKALVLAGRHPHLWAGVAAWGGIYDIVDWYGHNRGKDAHYTKTIAASCGGAPRPGTAAEVDCRARSPRTHLANAAGKVPVLIAHGTRDTTVPLRHALRAYDALAAPPDRFTEAQHAFVQAHGALPADLRRQSGAVHPVYERSGAPIRLERRSGSVTLIVYEGGHDMAYNPTLRWLAEQRRR